MAGQGGSRFISCYELPFPEPVTSLPGTAAAILGSFGLTRGALDVAMADWPCLRDRDRQLLAGSGTADVSSE